MKTIKTTTGVDIILDGDLLAVMEALYKEVTARKELEAVRAKGPARARDCSAETAGIALQETLVP